MKRSVLALSFALALAVPGSHAVAQTAAAGNAPIVACPSQEELEQSIDSQGSITSDSCTMLEVNSLTSDSGQLCLIDFGLDEGFLGGLRDAAFSTQWWVRCDLLAAAAVAGP